VLVVSEQGEAIGVDLGGQSLKLAMVDAAGRVYLHRHTPLDAGRPVEEITALVVQAIAGLQADAKREGLVPRCVGMVMPGYMDRDRTRLLFAANLPTLNGGGFLAGLRQAVNVPMVFDADSNAAAYAEYRFGAGRGIERLIVVAIGTGIGAGVMIGGAILRIWNHIAGSLGHVIVDPRGRRCPCGARGCVETVASGPALERLAAELADRYPDSSLAAWRTKAGRLTGIEIAAALAEQDAAAAEAVRECGWWLGVAIASWAVIYRPHKVVIGGGIAALGEPLLEAIRAGLTDVGQPSCTADLAIEPARLGPDAGLIGAAALAREETCM
jgi:glucokinase